ncbi:MAG: enoyl-CoA hydratase-related protein [Thiohalobacteraceae bacterium]
MTTEADIGTVIYEVRDSVALLTLNRPDRRNALGGTLREDIVRAMNRASTDDAVRAVILSGRGAAFCAGGDLKEMTERFTSDGGVPLLDRVAPKRDRVVLSILESPKPVIAAVNGAALGAGMNLALAADIRIASTQAQFAQTFVKRGNVPDYGGTYLLPRIVGVSKALDLIYTGRTIDAQEALKLEIVGAVESADDLLPAAFALAREIAANAPVAVQLSKQIVYRNLGSIREALDRETAAQNICFDTEDNKEGFRAFLEKRSPVFRGR